MTFARKDGCNQGGEEIKAPKIHAKLLDGRNGNVFQ
jgi:hypothetical protein